MEQLWVLKVVQKLEYLIGDDKNVLIAKMEYKVEQRFLIRVEQKVELIYGLRWYKRWNVCVVVLKAF